PSKVSSLRKTFNHHKSFKQRRDQCRFHVSPWREPHVSDHRRQQLLLFCCYSRLLYIKQALGQRYGLFPASWFRLSSSRGAPNLRSSLSPRASRLQFSHGCSRCPNL